MPNWLDKGRERRARRALDRQLAYIEAKAERLNGKAGTLIPELTERSRSLLRRLGAVRPIGTDARILEVGSGVTGHIFFLDAKERVGIDPLADHFRPLFPWHKGIHTIAAAGEALPFPDDSFDLVMSDNVVDHAEDPARIAEEMVRVLAPGGLLYFTVNVHHPVYGAVAAVHSAWRSLGLPGEIGPFADHTVHLTPRDASQLFAGRALKVVSESAQIGKAKRKAREAKQRHPGDFLKRLFYKNAVYELVAIKGS